MNMITLNCRAGHLATALQNALTFVDETLFPAILFILDGSRLSVFSTDGYVSIIDSITVDPDSEAGVWCTSPSEAEKLYKNVKGLKDLRTKPGWVKISTDGQKVLETQDVDRNKTSYRIEPVDPTNRFYQFADAVFFGETPSPVDPGPVAIHPERLRDVGRVKLHCEKAIRDIAVMDILHVENPFTKHNPPQPIWLIKYGPDVRLALAGINRAVNARAYTYKQTALDGDPEEMVKKCLWEESEDVQPRS
jgi:hypothetical protein